MPKIFAVSDIHGFYDELREALDNAGFDPENEEHLLVVCGDTTDRGPQPSQVISYLSKLMRDKKCVVVRGNHEDLVIECCERGYPGTNDYSNGTFETICTLGGAGGGRTFEECIFVAEGRFKAFVNKMVNYFETENYIFVHGWIPVKATDGLPAYYKRYKNGRLAFDPDWRYAHASAWEEARWLNGIDMAQDGFIEPNKTIVCGHWHCSYGHHLKSIKTGKIISEFKDDACFDPFYDNGIIAIDACTAHTNKVNVLVLEDNFLDEKETEQ